MRAWGVAHQVSTIPANGGRIRPELILSSSSGPVPAMNYEYPPKANGGAPNGRDHTTMISDKGVSLFVDPETEFYITGTIMARNPIHRALLMSGSTGGAYIEQRFAHQK